MCVCARVSERVRERVKEKGYNRSMQIDSNEETKSEFLCQTNEVQLCNFFCAKDKIAVVAFAVVVVVVAAIDVVVAVIIGLLKLLNRLRNYNIRIQKRYRKVK